MLIVFDYTTAMAMEEYPETWGSNWIIIDVLILGDFKELRGIYIVKLFSWGRVGNGISQGG